MIKVSFRTCHFYFKRFNRILLLIRNPANHFLERRFLSIHQNTYPINLSGYPNHPKAAAYKRTTDSIVSHTGTSKGRRTIMTIGEVNGIMEHQIANGPSGLSEL